MDWCGKLADDGVTLTDVTFREPLDGDVVLAQPPPTPARGVFLRYDEETRCAFPFRPRRDVSDLQFAGALAVRLSSGWEKLAVEDKARFQAIIDFKAAAEMSRGSYDAKYEPSGRKRAALPEEDEPLVIDHDAPFAGEQPTG